MKDKPLVSIITPCYNAGSVIAETIESVLQQTYQNWELLICDDCSKDNSVEVISSYCAKDSRIKLFSTSHNTGTPAEPRNIAIDNAKGFCLAFLDADDLWLPNKLEVEVGFMIANDYKMVYSNYEKITWEGKRDGHVIKAPDTATYKDMVKSCVIPACITTMIRRDIVGEIRFKTMPKEDYAFWLKVFRKGFTAYNTKTLQGLYRQNKNSRSANKLKLISGQWNILRKEEKIGFFRAIYYMVVFMIKGYLKYIK